MIRDRIPWLAAALLLASCGDDGATTDAAAPTVDAAGRDGGPSDSPEDGGAGDNDDGGPDTTGRVPVFFAQGSAGRTVISCDRGQTWIADQSDPEPESCADMDCGHHAGAARGIAYGGGYFYATFGWGRPGGEIRRSPDGATWEAMTMDTTYADLAYGNGLLLGGGKWKAVVSSDQGESWEDANVGPVLEVANARSAHFVPHGDGLFLIGASSSGDNDLILSDTGTDWWHPDPLPEACGGGTFTGGGVELVGDTIVVVGGGVACRSSDGGHSFEAVTIDDTIDRWKSDLVFDGSRLSVWASGQHFTSDDGGATWNAEAVTSDEGPGRHQAWGDGVYVGVGGAYDDQAFYRSTDGTHWDRLPAEAFTAGHGIAHLLFTWVEPNDVCGG